MRALWLPGTVLLATHPYGKRLLIKTTCPPIMRILISM
jgi:hypothetical protein